MITVGQTLWGINKITGEEDSVEVVSVSDTTFRVAYHGNKCTYPLTDIGMRFFMEPQRKSAPSCDKCALRNRGVCTSLSNVLCCDYQARQEISKDEIENWPKYGDATALRLGDRKHFNSNRRDSKGYGMRRKKTKKSQK